MFDNWEWQGEGDYYSLVGIDPMGKGLNQYSVLAEIRRDADGYVGWTLLPEFNLIARFHDEDNTDMLDPHWVKLSRLQREIVRHLAINKIIKEKDKGVIE